MSTRSSHRRSSEADWVNSTIVADLGEPPAPKTFERKESVYEAAQALEDGLTVKELDTVPGEFLDLFELFDINL